MGLSDRLRDPQDSGDTGAEPSPEAPATDPARVHIDADGEIVIDLRANSEPAVTTTDIRCPNCGGTLRVDDLDRDVLAAQLSCIDCGFMFLQRLRRGAQAAGRQRAWTNGSPDPRPLPHRKLVADEPEDPRTPEERERTIRSGAEYFWSG